MPAHELTSRQHSAILHLLGGKTIVDAAKAAGVAEKTLHAWLKEPAFAEELAAARRQAIGTALDVLTASARDAAAVVVALVNDKTVAPLVRLRAAEALLDRLSRWVELEEMQRRIEALEARLASNTQ